MLRPAARITALGGETLKPLDSTGLERPAGNPAGLLESRAVRRTPLLLLTLLAIVALTSPAAAGRRSLAYRLPVDAIEGLSFTVDHRVQTRAVELPPEAEPYDVQGLMTDLGEVKTLVTGRIERTVARVFRDRSLGLVSRVTGLSGTVDRGAGAQPASLDGLEGKSVSMRALDSGELLASLGWSHMAGAGRGGDLVRDVLLLSVLRLPFMLPEGEGALPTSFRLRVPVDGLLNLDQSWNLAWTSTPPPAGCRRCAALHYEATMTEAAEDRHPARPMDSASTGEATGTLVLGPRGALVSHDFAMTWTRTVRSLRENGTRRAELEQVHGLTGRLEGAGR